MKILTMRSCLPILLLTMSAQGVAGWASFFLSPASREVATTLGLPFSWIGWQVGSVYGSTLIGCLFAGRVIDRIGALRGLQLSMLLTILGAILAVIFARSSLGVLFMFVGSIFIGFGYSLTNPSSSELLMLFSGKRGGLIFSIKQSSVPLGLVVAGLATPLCTKYWGWQSCVIPLVLAAFLSILMLEFARSRLSRTRSNKDRERRLVPSSISFAPLRGVFRLCKTPHLLWLALASVSLSPLQILVMSYTSTFAVEYLGFGLLAGGLLLSLSQGVTFLARPIWGILSDRYIEPRRLVAMIALSAGFFSALLLFLPRGVDFPIAALLFSLLAACAVGWNGLFMMSLAMLSRTSASRPDGMSISVATSSALVFTYGSCFVGPALVPALLGLVGDYANVFALYGVCGSAAAVYCLRRSWRS